MGEQRATEGTVSKGAAAASAQEKLTRKSAEVEVLRYMSITETLERNIEELKKSNEPDNLEKIKEAERRVAELRQDTICGVLVPLKLPEMLMVQGLSAETRIMGKDMGFDLDVQLYVMWKANATGIVYYSLRKKDNPRERYFTSQEDLAGIDEATLVELDRKYREAFSLTEEERKNT